MEMKRNPVPGQQRNALLRWDAWTVLVLPLYLLTSAGPTPLFVCSRITSGSEEGYTNDSAMARWAI